MGIVSGANPFVGAAPQAPPPRAPVQATSNMFPKSSGYSSYKDPVTGQTSQGYSVPTPYDATPQGQQQNTFDAQNAMYKAQSDALYRQMANQSQDTWAQWRAAGDQLGFGQTDYNLGLEELGLNRNLAQSQLGNRDAIIANLRQNYGLNDEDIANRLARSWLDQQVNEGVLGQQQRQQGLQTQQELSSAQSRAIAGGGMFFPGHGVGQQQTQDLGNMAQEILRQKLRGVTEGGGLEREGIGIGGRKERLGLDRQILGEEQGKLGDQTNLSKLDLQKRQMANQWASTQNQTNWKRAAMAQQIANLPEDMDPQLRAIALKIFGGQ